MRMITSRTENVADACEPNVHPQFIFHFENGQGIKGCVLSLSKKS